MRKKVGNKPAYKVKGKGKKKRARKRIEFDFPNQTSKFGLCACAKNKKAV